MMSDSKERMPTPKEIHSIILRNLLVSRDLSCKGTLARPKRFRFPAFLVLPAAPKELFFPPQHLADLKQ